MSEKKELNQEQLEKVSGGSSVSASESGLTWAYDLGANVELISNGTRYYGTITKQGRVYVYGMFMVVYYIAFPNNPENDTWYVEEAIKYRNNDRKLDEQYRSTVVVTAEQ